MTGVRISTQFGTSLVRCAMVAVVLLVVVVHGQKGDKMEELCMSICSNLTPQIERGFLMYCTRGASLQCCALIRETSGLEECHCSEKVACNLDPFFGGMDVFEDCGVDNFQC